MKMLMGTVFQMLKTMMMTMMALLITLTPMMTMMAFLMLKIFLVMKENGVLDLVMSLVLLICDRESEEILYKEREAEDEEGEEEK